tara:strand:+ start:193 stop:402 length:210 start_codon:yes stop_codon:yes gene_type:complete
MAFKMKGFPMQSVSAFKSHPSKELDRLQSDVETFEKQYNKDKNEKTKQDLDQAREALEVYMMDPHDEAS